MSSAAGAAARRVHPLVALDYRVRVFANPVPKRADLVRIGDRFTFGEGAAPLADRGEVTVGGATSILVASDITRVCKDLLSA